MIPLFTYLVQNFVSILKCEQQSQGYHSSDGSTPSPPPQPSSPLIFRPNRGPKSRKDCFWRPRSPYLRVWMTSPPPPLSEGMDPPLHRVREFLGKTQFFAYSLLTALFLPTLCLAANGKPVKPEGPVSY